MASRVALTVVIALVTAGAAAGAPLDRSWTAPGAITSLEESAQSVAAGVGWTPKSCEEVILWEPGIRARHVFHLPGPCPATSTGRGIAAVSVLGDRVVFLSYVGGNTREW